ncbi:MAG: hypothetical protein M5U09_13690 [Gammaproteobacteria bacterium]|nr:hypothetical protein [Gammaproteobacteria bacterium]
MVARLAADEFAGHRPAIDLLVVTADGLWMLDGDGVVMECPPWGYAIGSGAKEAAAVLYDRREEAAAVAVQRALDVACARVTTCGDGTNLYRVQFVGQVLQEVVS